MTYGKHPKTLAVVRSLGRSGHRVTVMDDTGRALSSFSKYCNGFVRTGSPSRDPLVFLDRLRSVIAQRKIDLVIPMDDAEIDLLQSQWTTIGYNCALAAPSLESYGVARDKLQTVRLAERLNLRIPRSFEVSDRDCIMRIPEAVGLPAIIKPRRGSGSRGFRFIESKKCLELVASSIGDHDELLAQEFIPSAGGIGVSLLMKDGAVRASFTHRRLLEFPDTGGPSLVRESCHNQIAESGARELLETLKWNGVAMVEFRLDSRTGKPVLMEINPRFWGSLPLAIACGIDFPKLLCDMYEFGDVAPSRSYPDGVGCVNLLPFGVSSVLGQNGVRRFARVLERGFKFKHFDVESFDDPMPAFGALLYMLRSTLDSANIEMFFHR